MIEPTIKTDQYELYLADCLDVLPHLEGVDAVVTDPPYGVGLGEVRNGQSREKDQQAYGAFSDTPEYVQQIVIPAIRSALAVSKRGVVTPGTRNAFEYPKPRDMGVWWNPAGSGRGRWGYMLAHPILYYGKDPRAGRLGTASSVTGLYQSVERFKELGHPCPKPLPFTRWLVEKAMKDEGVVLDPFMGSGTTGVAALELGHKFIGIEIDEEYFEIAHKRIKQAASQRRMFV